MDIQTATQKAKSLGFSVFSEPNPITTAIMAGEYAFAEKLYDEGHAPEKYPSTIQFLADHPPFFPNYVSQWQESKERLFYRKHAPGDVLAPKEKHMQQYAAFRQRMLDKLFAREGINEQLETVPPSGQAPLYRFAQNGEMDLIKQAYAAGANVFKSFHNRGSILHAAFEFEDKRRDIFAAYVLANWVKAQLSPEEFAAFLNIRNEAGYSAVTLCLKEAIRTKSSKKKDYASFHTPQHYAGYAGLFAKLGANIHNESLDPFAPEGSSRPNTNALLLAIRLGDEEKAVSYVRQGVIAADGNHNLNNPLVLAITNHMPKLAEALLTPEQTPQQHREAHEKALVSYMSRVAVLSPAQRQGGYHYNEVRKTPLTALAELPVEQEPLYQTVWALYQQKAEWLLTHAEERKLAHGFQLSNMICEENRASLYVGLEHDRWDQVMWQIEHGAELDNELLSYDAYSGYQYSDTFLHIAIKKGHTEAAIKAIQKDAQQSKSSSDSMLGKKGLDQEFPLEMAAKRQQWSVVNAIMTAPENRAKYYGYGIEVLLQEIYSIEQAAIDKPEDTLALRARERLRQAYPALRSNLLDSLQEWASGHTFRGYDDQKPRPLYWATKLGDKVIVDAFLEHGASAIQSGNTCPLKVALSLIEKPLTNPDSAQQQTSRKDIFDVLLRATVKQYRKAHISDTFVKAVQNVAVTALLPTNGTMINVPEDLLEVGVSERSQHSTLNLTLLHAAVIAKDSTEDAALKSRCDDLIQTVLQKSLDRDANDPSKCWHRLFINNGGYFNEMSARLSSLNCAAVGFDGAGEAIKLGGKGISAARMAVMANPVDLTTIAALQEHGAKIELSAEEWEKLATAIYEKTGAGAEANQEDAVQRHIGSMALLPSALQRSL